MKTHKKVLKRKLTSKNIVKEDDDCKKNDQSEASEPEVNYFSFYL